MALALDLDSHELIDVVPQWYRPTELDELEAAAEPTTASSGAAAAAAAAAAPATAAGSTAGGSAASAASSPAAHSASAASGDAHVHQRKGGAAHFPMQDVVRSFLIFFRKHIKEHNVHDIHNLYESSFNKLTERFFKSAPWPAVDSIAHLLDNDATTKILYKELYYRHLYTKTGLSTTAHRFESWQNYNDLFAVVLNAPSTLDLELPIQWLWDIIDEFIYQFQSFCGWRSKLTGKSDADRAAIRANPDAWSVVGVLNLLQALIAKSNVLQYLQNERANQPQPADDFSSHTLFRMLGYFALIGLSRVHCLLGDYWLALKTLEPIDLGRKGMYGRVTACQLSLYYHLGFAYMMLRRYVDAIKSLTHILLFISRTKQFHSRSYQSEQIGRKNEQMYAMLAICVSLCPQRIDENVHTVLKEKFASKLLDMQRGELSAFADLFNQCAPKYAPLSPSVISDDDQTNYALEPLANQRALFLREVKQQVIDAQLPTLRSYLKLYSTIDISKLAEFGESDEATYRQYLVAHKHKTHNPVWSSGPVLSGSYVFTSDVEFYIDQNMVHIADTKLSRRFGEFFLRHIIKCDEVNKNLTSIPLQSKV